MLKRSLSVGIALSLLIPMGGVATASAAPQTKAPVAAAKKAPVVAAKKAPVAAAKKAPFAWAWGVRGASGTSVLNFKVVDNPNLKFVYQKYSGGKWISSGKASTYVSIAKHVRYRHINVSDPSLVKGPQKVRIVRINVKTGKMLDSRQLNFTVKPQQVRLSLAPRTLSKAIEFNLKPNSGFTKTYAHMQYKVNGVWKTKSSHLVRTSNFKQRLSTHRVPGATAWRLYIPATKHTNHVYSGAHHVTAPKISKVNVEMIRGTVYTRFTMDSPVYKDDKVVISVLNRDARLLRYDHFGTVYGNGSKIVRVKGLRGGTKDYRIMTDSSLLTQGKTSFKTYTLK